MSLRSFILGLTASFGIAWLAVVIIPYLKMRRLEPLPDPQAQGVTAGVFFPKRTGRIVDGAKVYAANGCYLCHTQVVRPTYAGNDIYRSDWGGLMEDATRGDTRRETNAFDFIGETYAQIGLMRVGPDLSNVGTRIAKVYAPKNPEAWLYAHLFNPRDLPQLFRSNCPPQPFLFERVKVNGAPSADALNIDAGAGYEWLPGKEAKALASYLLSLRKDHPVPPALDFAPAEAAAGN